MRITPNITANNSLYNIQSSRTLLDSIQEKISSGKNFNRVSDDPVSANLLMGLNDRFSANGQYKSNISKANIWLNMTATALDGMANTMKDIKTLVATVTSGSNNQNTLNDTAASLTLMRQQLADLGNTQLEDQYLFAGTATDTKPFDPNVDTTPPAVSPDLYNGNDNVNTVQIDVSATENLNIPGSAVLGDQSGGNVNTLWELDKLIAAIKVNDIAGIQAGADKMELAADQIQRAQVTAATRISRLDFMDRMLDNTKNTLETVYSNVQNADYAKLAVQLTQQKTAFEATLSSTAKITQTSLLDYL